MEEHNYHNDNNIKDKYMIWFFAGAESQNDKFNVFTGSFIRLMKLILQDDFDLIRGIYSRFPIVNVIWALNNAQRPVNEPSGTKITGSAFNQIVSGRLSPETQLVLLSSSSGSIVAAQTACYLAEKNRNNVYLNKPFHVILGSSMISKRSVLYEALIRYQEEGIIGTIIYDEVQDEGDNSIGVGGLSRREAYSNAFGLILPVFSRKFTGPSFLNTDIETGHIHRKRSKSIQKALDYIDVILVKNNLAGEYYREKALEILDNHGFYSSDQVVIHKTG